MTFLASSRLCARNNVGKYSERVRPFTVTCESNISPSTGRGILRSQHFPFSSGSAAVHEERFTVSIRIGCQNFIQQAFDLLKEGTARVKLIQPCSADELAVKDSTPLQFIELLLDGGQTCAKMTGNLAGVALAPRSKEGEHAFPV